ncbi:5-oxoprolinase subunit PxpB [Mucilaginibacter sp. RS28]|uniref:5-oxoprolinase subunit PxpB n=1 Tax=Mucilaginibacter straminoryzae TaxID=2932774 RepID=A0A9X1X7F4_9SPHI|nr:5-oxoprolinase subunit PxpB [Mucilaginibacter straminoryzae]MCJ8211820.1 5-oxoprolinase subunit PxpB [Mucilaginibacter straminoryzae]
MQPSPNYLRIYPLSEKAVSIAFGQTISEQNLRDIALLNKLIEQQPLPGLLSTVPAYATLTLFYEPGTVKALHSLKGETCAEKIKTYIDGLGASSNNGVEVNSRRITIPVCYEGDYAPDLNFVAEHNNLKPGEVVHLHSSVTYKVYMIGFVPGFAYLGGMDKRIATPRLSKPRTVIPAGSVGIAGEQTGVYPLTTPGGWQLIGRTPVQLFNPLAEAPALLKAGDEVIFKSISLTEFNEYLHENPYR